MDVTGDRAETNPFQNLQEDESPPEGRKPISIEHEPEHYDPFPEVIRSRARLVELLAETEPSLA